MVESLGQPVCGASFASTESLASAPTWCLVTPVSHPSRIPQRWGHEGCPTFRFEVQHKLLSANALLSCIYKELEKDKCEAIENGACELVGLKLKCLLPCPAPLCVLTCTALIFGSWNSFKLLIIPAFSPRLRVSESMLTVPSLSLALQLPDGGSGGEAGEASSPPPPDPLPGICGASSPHCCLQAAPPKEKNGRAGSSGAGGVRLWVLCRRISENMLNSACHPPDTHWVLLFT